MPAHARALGRAATVAQRHKRVKIGYDHVHAAVDDHSHLAALRAIGARHLTIRPHCPWQNGKVERFNRTIQIEWAYRQIFATHADRADALDPWVDQYNTRRRHQAIGGLPPISRLS